MRFDHLLLMVIMYLMSSTAIADGDRREVHLGTGFITGQFQGKDVKGGSFTSDLNLLAEFWIYETPQKSWTFNMLLSNESTIARTRYFGAGVGQRYMLNNDGVDVEQKIDGDFINIKPKFSYYVGWDAHVAQFLVISFGDILSSYATLAEMGGVAGVRIPQNTKYIFDLNASASMGYSLTSSITVTTLILRVMCGVGMTF